MFRHDQARQVLAVGAGALDILPAELHALKVRSVCLIGSPRSLASWAGTETRKALADFEVRHEFGDVAPHAPISATERIATALLADPPDVLLAVGGGSVSDTAKAVAILLADGFPLAARCSTFSPPDQFRHVDLPAPKVPVVSVPTTLSGAEITPGGGATDANGLKRVFWDPKVASRVVVYDSNLFTDVPVDLLLATGMNGLAHCAEALYSRTASPLTDGAAVEGARRFAAALPRLRGGPTVDVLTEVLSAACLGGLAISNARVGLHHAICHVVGAAFGVPHGVANSVMLPYVLQFNYDATADRQQVLAEALAAGLGADPSLDAAHLVALVQARAGVPATLADAGLAATDLPRVAAEVMQDRGLYFNPKPVTDENTVLGVLRRAWAGDLDGTA